MGFPEAYCCVRLAIGFYIQTLAESGRSGTAPGLELHFGVYPGVELDVIASLAFNAPTGEGAQRGFGDMQFGIKYALTMESEWVPQMSLVPLLDLATGDAARGLGNGGGAGYLGIALQKHWGKLQTYASGGYWINYGPGNRNYGFAGWQVQYQFSERWAVGAEIFHMTSTTDGQGASTGFNIGGQCVFDRHNQLLFSAGRGLQNAAQTNRVSSYVGYQYSF